MGKKIYSLLCGGDYSGEATIRVGATIRIHTVYIRTVQLQLSEHDGTKGVRITEVVLIKKFWQ